MNFGCTIVTRKQKAQLYQIAKIKTFSLMDKKKKINIAAPTQILVLTIRMISLCLIVFFNSIEINEIPILIDENPK